MDKNQLIDGVFFNVPEEGCIKELFYSKLEDVFGVQKYLYGNIINTHNKCLTDKEFITTILMSHDDSVEYASNSSEYKTILNMLSQDKIVPDCMGISRAWMYSTAARYLLGHSCNNCICNAWCKTKGMTCERFVDGDLTMSEKTYNVVRRYYIEQIANLNSFDQLLEYMRQNNVSVERLESLNIKYIVFLNVKGRIGALRGHAQVYADRQRAEEYANSLVSMHMKEAQKHQIQNSLSKVVEGSSTLISYKTRFGQEEIRISLISI